jgi:2-polyprenyl-3-methyl-5-hydroxy-6-metoxy-1,4-benzoquinol methylase
MANARGKLVDTTYLSIDQAEERGFIHRDYIAHCFRWTFVVKYLLQSQRYKTFKVLDVGCGREIPLAKLLYSSKMSLPNGYVGVDFGPIEPAEFITKQTKMPVTLLEKTDVLLLDEEHTGQYDLAVSFEVLEHVEPNHMLELLEKVHKLLKPGGTFIVSTPNFDPASGAAGNHVNELEHRFLDAVLNDLGLFNVSQKYGTFISQKDFKDVALEQDREVFDRLRHYYDTNVLSSIFAPLYAAESRNCLWVLTKNEAKDNQTMASFNVTDWICGSSSNVEAWQAFFERAEQLRPGLFVNTESQSLYTEDKTNTEDFQA